MENYTDEKIFKMLFDGILIDIAHLRARHSILAEMTLSVFAELLSKEQYENLEKNYHERIVFDTENELKSLEGIVYDARKLTAELSNIQKY